MRADWVLILEYLKVLLAWPAVSGGIALVFLGMFRRPIAKLIDRIKSIKLPGGGEVSASQAEALVDEVPVAIAPPPEPIGDAGLQLPRGDEVSAEDVVAVATQVIQSTRAEALLWEYRYLNRFLVHNTVRVLDWFAGLAHPILVDTYHTMWLPVMPEEEERKAVLHALLTHGLIAQNLVMLSITPKGQEYREWRTKVVLGPDA